MQSSRGGVDVQAQQAPHTFKPSLTRLSNRFEKTLAIGKLSHVLAKVDPNPLTKKAQALPRRQSSSQHSQGAIHATNITEDYGSSYASSSTAHIQHAGAESAALQSNDLQWNTLSDSRNGGHSSVGDHSFGSNANSSSSIHGTNGMAQSSEGHGGFEHNGSGDDANDGGEESHNQGNRGKDKAKKPNPLADLIETEMAYVSELGKIIKKVAGAWSRSNFPPAELDTMFRNVESIYRVNRSFLKSLKEIGPNPSSPRALGDLLMRWIDDLESPYLRYCNNYFTDFDSWPAVQSNTKLPPLLESISETTQSDGTPIVYSDRKRQPGQLWTLDQLFALPQTRLKYYKKLYSRLLKSTQEGRSDHRLLIGANERLDELLQQAKKRITMSVLDEGPVSQSQRKSQESSGEDTTENTADSAAQHRTSSSTSTSVNDQAKTLSLHKEEAKPVFSAVVHRESPPRSPSTHQAPDMLSRSSSLATTPEVVSVESLEQRLDTAKTLDIFTMKPKKCQLRMNPPGIPFQRSLRKAANVVIRFTPTTTGREVNLRRAYLFLLTDLFLICERKTSAEQGQATSDMWLLYPPLAGKHLRVMDDMNQENAFSIVVLKKERLIVYTDSRETKQQWIEQLEETQKFATNLGLKVKTELDKSQAPSLTSASLAPAPGVSPVISVTPSEKFEKQDKVQEGDTVKDLTHLLDGSLPFSPESRSPSRGNSFSSFVAEPFQDKAGTSADRSISTVSSPALAASFSRSPEPFAASLPPLPFQSQSHSASPPPALSSPMLQPGSVVPSTQNVTPAPIGPGAFLNGRPPASQGPPSALSRPPAPQFPSAASNRPPFPHLPQGPQMTSSPFGRPGGPTAGMGPSPRPPLGLNGFGPSRPPQPPANRPPHATPPSSQNGHGPKRPPSASDTRGTSGAPKGPSPPARSQSSGSQGPLKLPSDFLKQPGARPKEQYSPPSSPPLSANRGPKSSTVAAQMRCRLYLKQSHGSWKALGNARLKLYHLMPDDVKQLVVENDKKPTPLISSIILPDGVERVGKVGVAVELSDNGSRTGIIYMLHLRSEESAFALFGQLLEGSDRTVLGTERGIL